MMLMTVKTGGRFEEIGSYSRAKRVGPFIFVAGTTAIEPSGKLHAPNDAYAQTIFILSRIEGALKEMGADLRHIVRTTAFLTNMESCAGGFVKAHGEIFKGIDPVTAAVEAGLTTPGMVVEISADAIIHDLEGNIHF